MTVPLTERQEKLWRFIRSCARSPSTDEMAAALGDTCRGAGVCRTLNALEAKGFIRRIRGQHRSVVALELNSDLSRVSTSAILAELARRVA